MEESRRAVEHVAAGEPGSLADRDRSDKEERENREKSKRGGGKKRGEAERANKLVTGILTPSVDYGITRWIMTAWQKCPAPRHSSVPSSFFDNELARSSPGAFSDEISTSRRASSRSNELLQKYRTSKNMTEYFFVMVRDEEKRRTNPSSR